MGIKDEIKSKGFQSEHEKAFVNLIYTASFFESKFLHFIEEYDLSPPHYNALRVLRGQYSCLLYTSPSPRDQRGSRMPSSA